MTMTASAVSDNPLTQFRWEPQPQAQALVHALVDDFLSRCLPAAGVRDRLLVEASVRFVDLLDTIAVPISTGGMVQKLLAAGFVQRSVSGAEDHFVHPAGLFPSIVLLNEHTTRLYLKVESVMDFLCAWQTPVNEPVQGEPMAPVRRARVAVSPRDELWVIERHGHRGMDVPPCPAFTAVRTVAQEELLRRRTRDLAEESAGFAYARWCVDGAVDTLGSARAADVFFRCERDYWQRRNAAARFQKMRQDQLGIGWANHDHHTYRCSRQHFAAFIAVMEKLGLRCRERFYAGSDAGWGAQILQHPEAGIVVFADVDLSPDELSDDFAHEGLEDRHELGTVGLWCALHGEAFLQAGMHHLECQFDFASLSESFAASGPAKVMRPFTDFPYLKQAFTEGETWPVDPARIERLLAQKRITEAQAEQFRRHGAIGSHLENLQRDEGFKGFNQSGVSDIIKRTDPRAQRGA